MPARSKFTSERRSKILGILSTGGSRRTACAVAGVDPATLRRWLERGRRGSEGGRWRSFATDVQQAETHPTLRALREEYDKATDSPWAAFRWLDRHNAWAEDEPDPGPIIIQLKFEPSGPEPPDRS